MQDVYEYITIIRYISNKVVFLLLLLFGGVLSSHPGT